VAAVRCGATTRLTNIMNGVFIFLLVSMGSGAMATIPMAALAGVTARMGLSLLDVSAWRRLPKMRLVDAGAFLVTAVGVLVVNAVAAVLAGCSLYAIRYAYQRSLKTQGPIAGIPGVAR